MNKPTFIIAEAGVNHNGDLDLAMQLIDVAAEAQADAVKFQTFNPQLLVTESAEKAAYQQKQDGHSSQLEMLQRLALNYDQFKLLQQYCHQKSILFMSSAFDFDAIDFLASIDMGIFKIPSGEITNLPYLRKIGALKRKVILSTGMAQMTEIAEALEVLIQAGTKRDNITVLQCTTEYPAPFECINLLAMKTIADAFGVQTGYSDHTEGLEVAIAAVALGAKVIEKHFTLSRDLSGPDHKASLEPKELKSLVSSIRHVELAMGFYVKEPSMVELKNASFVRKSIVASRDIALGELFDASNITTKRPGTGMSPMKWDSVVGQRASRAYKKNEMISI